VFAAVLAFACAALLCALPAFATAPPPTAPDLSVSVQPAPVPSVLVADLAQSAPASPMLAADLASSAPALVGSLAPLPSGAAVVTANAAPAASLAAVNVTIDPAPLVQPALYVLGGLLLAFGVFLRWLIKKFAPAPVRDILGDAEHFAEVEVGAIGQTLAAQLKADTKDGKIPAGEASKLLNLALDRIKADLGVEGVKLLDAATGNRPVNEYLISLIEAKVPGAKTLLSSLGIVRATAAESATVPVSTAAAEASQ
jgi:hypothetical protein